MNSYLEEKAKTLEQFSEICNILCKKFKDKGNKVWEELWVKSSSNKYICGILPLNPVILVMPDFYHDIYEFIKFIKDRAWRKLVILNDDTLAYEVNDTDPTVRVPIYPLYKDLNEISIYDLQDFSVPCLAYINIALPVYDCWDTQDKWVSDFDLAMIWKDNDMKDSSDLGAIYSKETITNEEIDPKFPYMRIGAFNSYYNYMVQGTKKIKNTIKKFINSEINSKGEVNRLPLGMHIISLDKVDLVGKDLIEVINRDNGQSKSEKHNDAADSLAYCIDSLGSVIDNYAEKTIENAKKKPKPTGIPIIDYLNGTLKDPAKVFSVDKMHDEYIKNCNKNEDNIIRVIPDIDCVIYNDPFTVIHWTDNTKTTVKVMESEIYDPEKGFAMAVLKKLYGNNDDYYDNIRKYLPDSK